MVSSGSLDDRLGKIRLVVLDVDGVLTDGRLTFDSNGTEYKTFNVQDGYGLRKLQSMNVVIGIITGRDSPIVTNRASELDIRYVIQGATDKGETLSKLLNELSLSAEQSLFVGDDEPDLPAMRVAGITVAVANAVDVVKERADWVTVRNGGEGAVREVCDRLYVALT
ncbi:MAG: HAD-IIIA family hydrolase [Gammaproteobacteria bacterium]|nr:HAD-IIIA family hydrolase [Gammaproteobacteria bacterium]